MTESVAGHLRSVLAKRRERYRSALSQIEQAWKCIGSGRRKFTFRVTLTSLWSKEGEENVIKEQHCSAKSLRDLIASVATEFKAVNHRSDIQGEWSVAVVLTPEVIVPLPEELWTDFAKQ